MIKVTNLTKKFKNGKGIFDLNFEVKKGEVFAFIGPNGAGKSTTIRHLMGFLKADEGNAEILGYDCWKEPEKIKESIGYLPGEIVFPEGMSAKDFLAFQRKIRNIDSEESVQKLVKRFKLNIDIPIKKMSKGMKQKLAIVAAFMGDPEIIFLDEPSTGLDPLMQDELIKLFTEKKKEGKTIFLSSHIFEEIETIADTICIIKNGKIVEYTKLNDISEEIHSKAIVTFINEEDIKNLKMNYKKVKGNVIEIDINNNINKIIKNLANCDVEKLEIKQATLRDIFKKYYEEEYK
ncbi:ABC transporter ATP-binding protein [uncultured Clostridium sp.]|uniref:ABC transporter ATP-binding protein n=1 Tax=uncultured Clostridium sp. TaxID=59620 RepID=UPI0025D52B2F|nr:ABC transporter ATP-binding protein [uncultured Clostridium sp.]